MKLTKIIFLVIIIFGFVAGPACYSQAAGRSINKYYSSLTSIISSNMNDPDKCVRDVKAFIERNSRWIDLIVRARENLKSDSAQNQLITSSQKQLPADEIPALENFKAALGLFSDKYPLQGERIEKLPIHRILKSSTGLLR